MREPGPMALVGRKHEALATVARPITAADDMGRLAVLAQRMIATCRVKGGIALAAPQVGVSERLVVTWDGHVWLNPQLAFDTEDVEEDREGCLSLPGRAYLVQRFTSCALTVQDLELAEVTVDLTGLEARMIQHEVDHLNGVLISARGPEVANPGPSALKL